MEYREKSKISISFLAGKASDCILLLRNMACLVLKELKVFQPKLSTDDIISEFLTTCSILGSSGKNLKSPY